MLITICLACSLLFREPFLLSRFEPRLRLGFQPPFGNPIFFHRSRKRVPPHSREFPFHFWSAFVSSSSTQGEHASRPCCFQCRRFDACHECARAHVVNRRTCDTDVLRTSTARTACRRHHTLLPYRDRSATRLGTATETGKQRGNKTEETDPLSSSSGKSKMVQLTRGA